MKKIVFIVMVFLSSSSFAMMKKEDCFSLYSYNQEILKQKIYNTFLGMINGLSQSVHAKYERGVTGDQYIINVAFTNSKISEILSICSDTVVAFHACCEELRNLVENYNFTKREKRDYLRAVDGLVHSFTQEYIELFINPIISSLQGESREEQKIEITRFLSQINSIGRNKATQIFVIKELRKELRLQGVI